MTRRLVTIVATTVFAGGIALLPAGTAQAGNSWERSVDGNSWEFADTGNSWERAATGNSWERAATGNSWE